ncbi:hypothetical protein NUACC21_74720 [Scytonema sp. NUACC21]
MLYKKKWVTATGYLYGLIKILRQDGWWLRFDTKEFAQQYGFTKTSLYRAMTALAADPDINFEWSAKEIRVRFGATKPSNSTSSAETIENPLVYSQQGSLVPHLSQNSQTWNTGTKLGTQEPNLEQPQPEAPTQQGVELSSRYLTDIKQTHTDSALADATPLPHPEDVCFKNNEEENSPNQFPCLGSGTNGNQFPNPGITPKANDQPSGANKINSEDQSSAAPSENNSQSGWECPNPRMRREFMAWLAQSTPFIQSSAHAANWCHKNPEDANLRWDDFMREKKKTTDLHAAFAGWVSEQHEMLVRQYKSLKEDSQWRLENFIARNAAWVTWVNNNHPEWLADGA